MKRFEDQDLSSLIDRVESSLYKDDDDGKLSVAEKKRRDSMKREQSGFFHVWFRGCNRYTVFYESEDFVGFLERCNSAAIKHKTAITAFVLMDNHVHLQIFTNNLNGFMLSLLISFNMWYNKRKSMSGQVFTSPFSSSQLVTPNMLLFNYLYILSNPVRAGICADAREYRWSSYHFTKRGFYNALSDHIGVHFAVTDFLFSSNRMLNNTILRYLAEPWKFQCEVEAEAEVSGAGDGVRGTDVTDGADGADGTGRAGVIDGADATGGGSCDSANNSAIGSVRGSGGEDLPEVCCGKVPEPKPVGLVRPTDSEVAQCLAFLLGSRTLADLDRRELINLLKALKAHTNATYRQISALTHESYAFVCRLFNS
ncbi:MAG: hypothetical protein WC077_08165 [Bacteroidales bacterium]